MDSSDSTSQAATVKAGSSRVAEALDMIPVIGKPSAWVYKHWGLAGLLSFIFGLLLGLGLVYFGAVPKSLVSANYKNDSRSGTKIMPSSVEVIPVRDPKPDWLQPYFDWLDEVAETKRVEPTRAGVGAVMSSPLPATEKFRWFLRASPGFDLNGRAFRLRKDGYLKVLEPVKEQNSIIFEVPEGEEGDRLAAVILVTWQGSQPQIEIQDTFHSTVMAWGR